jgi:hypothetical protein
MGCLSRIGCLVVVAAAGAAGWWLYGDRLPSELSRAAGKAANTVTALTDSTGASARRAADRESTPARPIAWATVSADAPRRAALVSALTKPSGPAYVTLTAPDLAVLLAGALTTQLPASVSALQVALTGSQVLLRTSVDVASLTGDGTLSRVLGTALSGRDSLQIGGTVEPVRAGLAQFRVQTLRIKSIEVPPRLIPNVLAALRRGKRDEALADDALALTLPKSVADVRIANGRLTLYKTITAP